MSKLNFTMVLGVSGVVAKTYPWLPLNLKARLLAAGKQSSAVGVSLSLLRLQASFAYEGFNQGKSHQCKHYGEGQGTNNHGRLNGR